MARHAGREGGAFIGGAYVGLTQAAGTLVTVKGGAEVIVVSIISLVAGFVVGALISAFCTLKLSRIVAAGGVEPASPAPPVPPGASAGPAPE